MKWVTRERARVDRITWLMDPALQALAMIVPGCLPSPCLREPAIDRLIAAQRGVTNRPFDAV